MLVKASGGNIRGRTRFQKLAFLYQNQSTHPIASYQYFPWDYGPYSTELQNYLEALARHGLVEEVAADWRDGQKTQRVYDYVLTPKGDKLLAEQKAKLEGALAELDALCARWAKTDLDELVRYVYKQHPEFTVRSKYAL